VLAHPRPVLSITFSDDGRTLVSANTSGRPGESELRILDPVGGKPLGAIDRDISTGTSLTLVPHSTLAALAYKDGTVHVVDVGLDAGAARLTGHAPKEAWAPAFAPDGRTLASAGHDGVTQLRGTTSVVGTGAS